VRSLAAIRGKWLDFSWARKNGLFVTMLAATGSGEGLQGGAHIPGATPLAWVLRIPCVIRGGLGSFSLAPVRSGPDYEKRTATAGIAISVCIDLPGLKLIGLFLRRHLTFSTTATTLRAMRLSIYGWERWVITIVIVWPRDEIGIFLGRSVVTGILLTGFYWVGLGIAVRVAEMRNAYAAHGDAAAEPYVSP